MSLPADISKRPVSTSEIFPDPDSPSSTPSPWRITLTITAVGLGGLIVMFTLFAELPLTSLVLQAHEAGDAVLQRVGLVLQSHTRVEDIVCRYGGEEFVMLLPGLHRDAIVHRAEELREAIHELNVRFRGETLAKITISCGVSMFPHQARTCAELIDVADHALYQAKQAGRDRVEVAA